MNIIRTGPGQLVLCGPRSASCQHDDTGIRVPCFLPGCAGVHGPAVHVQDRHLWLAGILKVAHVHVNGIRFMKNGDQIGSRPALSFELRHRFHEVEIVCSAAEKHLLHAVGCNRLKNGLCPSSHSTRLAKGGTTRADPEPALGVAVF